MVKMKVEIMSKETIKPSSPTPPHLKIFKLSLLDQIATISYVPLIFFYPINTHKSTSARLKDSLAKALTRFYPLAGRIKDHMSIDCNDDGVPFSEARVNCHMSELLNQPRLELMYLFVPRIPDPTEPVCEIAQVAIQLNIFECGSVAIGLCVSHKIMDLSSFIAFLKCWAGIARKSCDAEIQPLYTAASIFPPRESFTSDLSLSGQSLLIKEGKCVMRRFAFNSDSISTLKGKAKSRLVPYPTTVSAVSCFIWKRAMAASRERHGSNRASVLLHAVNMRRRMVPPLSQYSIGNIYWFASVYCDVFEKEMSLDELVGRLKEAISKINGNFVKKLQGEEGFLAVGEYFERVKKRHSIEKPDTYSFTSWCKSDLNVDFGWGKPIWVCFVWWFGSGSRNVVILNETTCGDGVEAWVAMNEHEMDILERDPEFLAFASMNPSITIPISIARL